MEYICLKARAKINLAIDVRSKRPDGYHDLCMIMQTVTLYDDVYIKKVGKSDYLKLATNIVYLPTDRRNIAFRAGELLREKYDIKTGIFINLHKRIPVSAGLGGGSADCAATLVGIRNLFGLNLDMSGLIDIGQTLGADVPFCVMRGTAMAEGIGERLTALPAMPPAYILLARPPLIVSTADVFGAFDFKRVNERPDTDKLLYCLNKRDLRGLCASMKNSLESVTEKLCPDISALKTIMMEKGALGAIMSGSGPTVFGVFGKRDYAYSARSAIFERMPWVREVFVARTFNPSSRPLG